MEKSLTLVKAEDKEKLLALIEQAENFIVEALIPGIDYGIILGTNTPTLWEPGAAKIMNLFNCYDDPEIVRLETEGVLVVVIKSRLKHRVTDTILAVGFGAASTDEVKYKYRWVPDPENYGFQKEGLKTRREKDKVLYRIPNPEREELLNTILKMAKKRALIDAVQDLPGVGTGLRKKFAQLGEEEKKQVEDFSKFWATARSMGFSTEEVHSILGVASMKDWVGSGKTLKEALEELQKHLSGRSGKLF